MALAGGLLAGAAFGLINVEGRLAHSQAIQAQTVRGSFQPSADGQGAYQRAGGKLQPVGIRAAVDPR
jgi:hypothetical protein